MFPDPLEVASHENPILVLGVGNLLMGDEGVGVHVLSNLEAGPPLPRSRLLDGGTGGVNLLEDVQKARYVIMIDATRDGQPAGTITRLNPQMPSHLPRGLSAHDFGLKDLFAAAYLLGQLPQIHLFTISIAELRPMCTELSAPVAAAVPRVVESVRQLAADLAGWNDADNCTG